MTDVLGWRKFTVQFTDMERLLDFAGSWHREVYAVPDYTGQFRYSVEVHAARADAMKEAALASGAVVKESAL